MINPYRVGQWVRGADFYNRESLLHSILAGPTDNLWIIGNRRIGKTSLLRAAEHQAANSAQFLPLFWDMQGDTREAQLIESLVEAIEYAQFSDEADKRWHNIPLPEDAPTIGQALRRVAREVRKHRCQLLLLCDEIEGLSELGQQEPRVLSELRRVMQQHPAIRTILTSTRRLSRLYAIQEQQDTSLFLEGFERRFLAHFDDASANQLICQIQSDRPLSVHKQVLAKLSFFSGNHPLILQKVCSQLFDSNSGELGSFNPDEFVVGDQLTSTFQQDFDSLPPDEAQILRLVNSQAITRQEIQQTSPNISKHSLRGILYNLTNLGLLREIDRKYYAGSVLLGQWLETGPPHHSAQVGVIKQLMRLEIFVSYSHKDEKEKNRLLTHLGSLQKNTGLVNVWSDDQIEAGAERENVMSQAIAQANVAILLITADFLASDFILGKTIPALLKRRKEEGLVIVPVIAKACAWKSVDWLAEMEIRPQTGQHVWRDAGSHVDEDLASIVEEIRAIVSRGF